MPGQQTLISMLPVEELGIYFPWIKSVEFPTLPTELSESVAKVNGIEYPYSSLWRNFECLRDITNMKMLAELDCIVALCSGRFKL